MTQEEKDKLLKYLCMALPYGVKVHIIGVNESEIDDVLTTATINNLDEWTVKPYLRTTSNMTNEEAAEYDFLLNDGGWGYTVADCCRVIDWLLEHHLDFMGLIPMDCAIDCTDLDVYKD